MYFKCVTCGVDNSSAWHNEEKILKDIIPRMGHPFGMITYYIVANR